MAVPNGSARGAEMEVAGRWRADSPPSRRWDLGCNRDTHTCRAIGPRRDLSSGMPLRRGEWSQRFRSDCGSSIPCGADRILAGIPFHNYRASGPRARRLATRDLTGRSQ